MGWHRIDPETGMPLANSPSALSRSPDAVLLNAVPGVDDAEGACYLGDGTWDMASTMPKEICGIIAEARTWPAETLRDLLLNGRVPKDVGADAAARLKKSVAGFWSDIDSCYEDDWDRGALPAEKRWICENLIVQFGG